MRSETSQLRELLKLSVDPQKFEQAQMQRIQTLFKKDDLRGVAETLVLLARLFIIEAGITEDIFVQRHRELAQQTFMSANKINYDRANTMRSLFLNKITWNFLEKLIMVCGYDLVDVALKLSNRKDGTILEIKKSDALEMIKDNPFQPGLDITHVDGVQE